MYEGILLSGSELQSKKIVNLHIYQNHFLFVEDKTQHKVEYWPKQFEAESYCITIQFNNPYKSEEEIGVMESEFTEFI